MRTEREGKSSAYDKNGMHVNQSPWKHKERRRVKRRGEERAEVHAWQEHKLK